LKYSQRFIYLCLVAIASGCATLPAGPSVNVLPPPGKPFNQFQAEDATCRKWAEQAIGLSPRDVQNQNLLSGAAIGTVVGAGAGALLGAASGHAGAGAALGAGSGLLVGSAIGSDSGRMYGQEAQRRYDNTYVQCMVANGNQVAVRELRRRRVLVVPPPLPPGYYYAPSGSAYQPPVMPSGPEYNIPPAPTSPAYPPPGTPPPGTLPPPGQ
jgi:outer membrane lipoprotein SlyB